MDSNGAHLVDAKAPVRIQERHGAGGEAVWEGDPSQQRQIELLLQTRLQQRRPGVERKRKQSDGLCQTFALHGFLNSQNLRSSRNSNPC